MRLTRKNKDVMGPVLQRWLDMQLEAEVEVLSGWDALPRRSVWGSVALPRREAWRAINQRIVGLLGDLKRTEGMDLAGERREAKRDLARWRLEARLEVLELEQLVRRTEHLNGFA